MTERLGVVTRQLAVRVVNFSAAGCLLETNVRMDIGTVGSLAVTIDGHDRTDAVRVVRCQPIAGAGSLYHVGAQFLWTGPPDGRTVRAAAIERHSADLSQPWPET